MPSLGEDGLIVVNRSESHLKSEYEGGSAQPRKRPAVSMHVAIVGSGPSGLYTADAVARLWPETEIDIFDRLPTPYGLVRGGIAPDHQSTKAVARAFERTLARPGTRFFGNVEIGRDLQYEELKAAYDLVIFSVGAENDRSLGIPGENLQGVYGAAAFVGWYNGHPRHHALEPLLEGSALAVIGNGNVAVDIVRVLAKTQAELADSDICEHAARRIDAARLTDLYLIGRRGPVEASFTPIELAELGELERCEIVVDPAELAVDVGPEVPEKEVKVRQRNLEILRSFALRTGEPKPMRIHVLFHAAPVAILGNERVTGLVLERTRVVDGRAELTGERFELPVETVIAAIGYHTPQIPGVPFDEQRGRFKNDEGWVEPGVYAAGWCKHGPRGVVGTNRTDAGILVKRIADDLASHPLPEGKPGTAAVATLLQQRGVRVIDFAGWKRIDSAEIARAQPPKPREKFVTAASLIAAAASEPESSL